jgi:hypothetical protein
MVQGHETQNNSKTTATSSSASGVSANWVCARPLKNVSVDTQYTGVIEEQKQKKTHIHEELAEFNCVQYRRLPANASMGKNVL